MVWRKSDIEYRRGDYVKVIGLNDWSDEDVKKLIRAFQMHFDTYTLDKEWESIGQYKEGFGDTVKFIYNHKYGVLGILKRYGSFYRNVRGVKSLAGRKEVKYLIETTYENAKKLFRRMMARAERVYFPFGVSSRDVAAGRISEFMEKL